MELSLAYSGWIGRFRCWLFLRQQKKLYGKSRTDILKKARAMHERDRRPSDDDYAMDASKHP